MAQNRLVSLLALPCLPFQSYYRKTWTRPDVKRIMANCQHLMLWDDHELDNDWVRPNPCSETSLGY